MFTFGVLGRSCEAPAAGRSGGGAVRGGCMLGQMLFRPIATQVRLLWPIISVMFGNSNNIVIIIFIMNKIIVVITINKIMITERHVHRGTMRSLCCKSAWPSAKTVKFIFLGFSHDEALSLDTSLLNRGPHCLLMIPGVMCA